MADSYVGLLLQIASTVIISRLLTPSEVGAFAIAAVLTPPDVISQLMLAIPLCLLYEIAIIAIWFTQRRRDKNADSEASTETI